MSSSSSESSDPSSSSSSSEGEEDDDEQGVLPTATVAVNATNKKQKRLVHEIEPPGLGPWWAFMLVNVGADEDTKKQTEVRLDTSPELINAIKNANDQGDWVTVMKLGPFYQLDKALAILSEWSDGTRGPGPRIAQGICLWEKYRDDGVRAAILNQSKREVQDIFRRRRASATAGMDQQQPHQQHGHRPGFISVREILESVSSNLDGSAPQRKRGRAKTKK
jgi:hypothetical protein